MRKIVDWLTTIIFIVLFLIVMGLCDIFERLAYYLLGMRAHQQVLYALQIALIQLLRLTGHPIKLNTNGYKMPTNRPLIVISNHQSIFDIPFKFWLFRRNVPKFVAKKELKNALAAGFHLQVGGHALIDRKDKDQALQAIAELGKRIEQNNWAAIIYPEGSRSRDGILKEFKPAGFYKLLANAPSALIVPVAIEGSWQLVKNKMFPVPFGAKCEITVLEPLEPQQLSGADIIKLCEERIRVQLKQSQKTKV
ncbi:MAG: 1-acyl-sn-glycerol-3-phosphate acyltransferase [Microscillaceae bacterium]|jgi:1-acyl-sn-glycerol-3-phosphate acyltransferase|nr:1-acyl-sn-glycerol-3-phosphate acyltransferase [Microscillaceae bacterium]